MLRNLALAIGGRYRRWRRERANGAAAFKRRAEARSMLVHLVEARNEPDLADRRKLIWSCLSTTVVLVEDGRITEGLPKIEDRFDEDHRRDHKFSVEILAPVEARGDDVWTRWETAGMRTKPVVHTVTARFDHAAGRLSRVVVEEAQEQHPASPWRRALDAIAANPVGVVGAIGAAIYLTLRLPAQFFYARLGTTPDEVGLVPQVLVPQSLLLLSLMIAGSALAFPLARSHTVLTIRAVGRLWQDRKLRAIAASVVGILSWGAIIGGGAVGLDALFSTESRGSGPPAEVPLPEWFYVVVALLLIVTATVIAPRIALLVPRMPDARREISAERRRRKDRWSRRSVLLLGALSTATVMVLVLSVLGAASGIAVRHGGDAGGELLPWRALPATIAWKTTAARAPLTNRCGELRFLGSANNQMVLYDTRVDRAFRIPVPDASVATEVGCLWVKVSAFVRGKRCDARSCMWNVKLNVDVSDDDAELTGVLSVRVCDASGCRYRRRQTVDTNELQLTAGQYRLTLNAADGERTAEQVIGVSVP